MTLKYLVVSIFLIFSGFFVQAQSSNALLTVRFADVQSIKVPAASSSLITGINEADVTGPEVLNKSGYQMEQLTFTNSELQSIRDEALPEANNRDSVTWLTSLKTVGGTREAGSAEADMAKIALIVYELNPR